MEAIRQTIRVENNSFRVVLPDNFSSEEVDVIILPSNSYDIPQWQIDEVRKRTEHYLKNPETATDVFEFLDELDKELEE